MLNYKNSQNEVFKSIKTYFILKQAWGQVFCERSTVVVGNTWNSAGANITSSDSVGKCLRSLSSFGSAEMRLSLATLHFTHITRLLREIRPHICQNFCCNKWKDALVFLPSEMRNWIGRWRRRWAKNSKWREDDVNQVREENGRRW